jgi:putative tricarboxylic transport membrane protein
MPWGDRALAVVMLAVSSVWAYLSFKLPFPAFAKAAKVGPGHFPAAVSILMGVLALILLIKTFVSKPEPAGNDGSDATKEESGPVDKMGRKHLVTGFVLFALFVFLTPMIGFIPASILLVISMVRIVGAMSWAKCGLTSVLITGFLWVVFVYWLQVPLPTGPMGV